MERERERDKGEGRGGGRREREREREREIRGSGWSEIDRWGETRWVNFDIWEVKEEGGGGYGDIRRTVGWGGLGIGVRGVEG